MMVNYSEFEIIVINDGSTDGTLKRLTEAFDLIAPGQLTPKGLNARMPIPTTFLVDRGGVVRWIDQSKDYMVRSAPQRVLAAIRAAL